MFRVKICGITRPEDAVAAADAGADAVGLNFYPGSKRCVDTARAQEIAAAVPPGVTKVGVFVNAAQDEIIAARDTLHLDLIQLHGDEPPEFLAELSRASGGAPIMRAFRLGPGGLTEVEAYLQACRRLGCLPALVLMDAHRPGSFGGTGETCDWSTAAQYYALQNAPPLVLAGGLTPENVAAAIRQVRPFAVDTASGVEASAGEKDAEKMWRFASAATRELANMSSGASRHHA
jgi:phosphoribosylanthranilate isomerase